MNQQQFSIPYSIPAQQLPPTTMNQPTYKYGLFLDCETSGPNCIKNQVVSIGVCLVNLDTATIAYNTHGDGTLCVKEWYLPPLKGQHPDRNTLNEFWFATEENRIQWNENSLETVKRIDLLLALYSQHQPIRVIL